MSSKKSWEEAKRRSLERSSESRSLKRGARGAKVAGLTGEERLSEDGAKEVCQTRL